MSRKKDPCQKQACDIQKCLKENNYVESRCDDVMREMRRCCRRLVGVNSVCCSGFQKEHSTEENKKGLSSSCPASACS